MSESVNGCSSMAQNFNLAKLSRRVAACVCRITKQASPGPRNTVGYMLLFFMFYSRAVGSSRGVAREREREVHKRKERFGWAQALHASNCWLTEIYTNGMETLYNNDWVSPRRVPISFQSTTAQSSKSITDICIMHHHHPLAAISTYKPSTQSHNPCARTPGRQRRSNTA